MGFNKDLLFEVCDETGEVDIPGKGTVTFRVMTRAEVTKIRKSVKSVADAIFRQDLLERRFVAAAMVDPELTVEDVARWQEASKAGEIDLVLAAINKASGLDEDYGKEVTKELLEDEEAHFRALPS